MSIVLDTSNGSAIIETDQRTLTKMRGYIMRIQRIGMKTIDHYFDVYEAKLNEEAEALRVKWRAERRREIIKLVETKGNNSQ